MNEKLKHYQVVLKEDDMKALKVKAGTDETGEALTRAVSAYLMKVN